MPLILAGTELYLLLKEDSIGRVFQKILPCGAENVRSMRGVKQVQVGSCCLCTI